MVMYSLKYIHHDKHTSHYFCHVRFVLLHRKDHVIRELQSQKKWTEQWGYLMAEYQQLQDNLLNLGSELEDELEDKLSLEFEQNMEPNLERNLLKLDNEYEGNLLAASHGLTDCTIKNEINQITRLQENVRGKQDIFKVFKWPQEGMI